MLLIRYGQLSGMVEPLAGLFGAVSVVVCFNLNGCIIKVIIPVLINIVYMFCLRVHVIRDMLSVKTIA